MSELRALVRELLSEEIAALRRHLGGLRKPSSYGTGRR